MVKFHYICQNFIFDGQKYDGHCCQHKTTGRDFSIWISNVTRSKRLDKHVIMSQVNIFDQDSYRHIQSYRKLPVIMSQVWFSPPEQKRVVIFDCRASMFCPRSKLSRPGHVLSCVVYETCWNPDRVFSILARVGCYNDLNYQLIWNNMFTNFVHTSQKHIKNLLKIKSLSTEISQNIHQFHANSRNKSSKHIKCMKI